MEIAKTSDKYFASLCIQIDLDMSEGRPILERQIHELSRWITKSLSNSGAMSLPEEFCILVERVDNYWRYETKTKDLERELSYARIYQLVSLVRIWENEKQQDVIVDMEVELYKNNVILLRIIYQSPGVTHKALSECLKCTPCRLSQVIPPLVDNGYLLVQRIGSKKYYHLSGKGERLLTYIEASEEYNKRRLHENHLKAVD